MKCPSCYFEVPNLKASVCGRCGLDLASSSSWQNAVRKTKLFSTLIGGCALLFFVGMAFYYGIPQLLLRLLYSH